MKANLMPICTNLLAFAYWLYLLDPLKSKPQIRRYKSLLKTKNALVTHLLVATFFALFATLLIINKKQRDIFSFIPQFFIILVVAFNKICRYRYHRDFHLVIRGDRLKTSWFDKLASILVLILPFLANIFICILFTKN